MPNHVKYCVSVLYPPMSNYQYTPGPRMGVPEFPNNWYQSTWFKGCLILLKNESCQNCVLTIPLCRGGRDEATVENRVEIGRRKPLHAPERRLPTRTDARHASHASSSPERRLPTRHTRHHGGTHLPRHQPRAELSRAEG